MGYLIPAETSRDQLIQHLESQHGISSLENLSYEELLAIHDDDHNGVYNEANRSF